VGHVHFPRFRTTDGIRMVTPRHAEGTLLHDQAPWVFRQQLPILFWVSLPHSYPSCSAETAAAASCCKLIFWAAFLKGKVICLNRGQTISRIEPSKVINHEFENLDEMFPGTVQHICFTTNQKIIFHFEKQPQ
jgi:hypothetical protein